MNLCHLVCLRAQAHRDGENVNACKVCELEMQEKAKRVKHAETFSCASRLNEQECVTVAVCVI